MKIGEAGDSLSLVRVIAAMVIASAALAGIGYLFDLIVGPTIGMSGWWTVFCTGGFILGGMIQATREFAVPQPAERRAIATAIQAREQAESQAAAAKAGENQAPTSEQAPASTPE